MAEAMGELVPFAKLGAPYGVRGHAHVRMYSDDLEALLNAKTWFLSGKPYQVSQARRHAGSLVVSFENISDRDEIKKLTHLEVALPKDSLPELVEDEFYWSDLIGLKVCVHGKDMGIAKEIYNHGASDVMVIKGAKEHHIPFVMHDTIKSVCFETDTIEVDWDLRT